MSFTYASPESSDKDALRFLIGDTDEEGHFTEDEEIEWILSRWMPIMGTLEYCAAIVADTIAARYAQEASYSADGVSVSLGPVGEQFRKLAATLRSQHRMLLVGGSPDAGGISPYEQRDFEIRNFSFGTGMHDDLSAGAQDYGDQGLPFYPVENYPGV